LQQTFLSLKKKTIDKLTLNQKKFIAKVIGTFIVVVLATGAVVIDAKFNGMLVIPFIAFLPFIGVAVEITAGMTSIGAAFFSEGGYHHHVAINTLHSLDGDIRPEDVTGLKNFTIIASDASFYNPIKSNIIMNDRTMANQMVQNGPGNKFTIMDPDGIQIVIRAK
jgi:hypothetical protein